MTAQTGNRAKLGAFVLAAVTCLLLGLYYIGSQKNIFHSTINVSSEFRNVVGLMSGNNVRFNGINVGVVSKVFAVADTAIKVEFTIDKGAVKFISKNAIASIGTDGLLGNKLINITPVAEGSPMVQEGDILKSQRPVQMDAAMRTLTMTNDNLKVITDNLKNVSEKFNNENSLLHVLFDTAIADNVRNAVAGFNRTGSNTAVITGDLSKIVRDIRAGKGTAGALLTDTVFSHSLNQTILNIESLSDSAAVITGNLKHISEKLKSDKSGVGKLLTDTMFVHNLNTSMESVKEGAAGFNENMEALKYSWPFKKYFKKQKKNKKQK